MPKLNLSPDSPFIAEYFRKMAYFAERGITKETTVCQAMIRLLGDAAQMISMEFDTEWTISLRSGTKGSTNGAPFTKQFLYFEDIAVDESGQMDAFFPSIQKGLPANVMIIISDRGYRSTYSCLATDTIADLHVLSSLDGFQCFPLRTYDAEAREWRENVTE